MRKITNNVTNAFENNRAFKSGNDEVKISQDSVQMLLHGNIIAEKTKGFLYITNCGWKTNTTKERLNGISGINICQKKGLWYLNGEAWNGNLIKIRKV